MTATTFDTLAYAKKMKAVGFTEQQAEIQAETLAEIMDEKAATKNDILMLKRDIKELEQATKRDLKELEYKLTIRLGSMIIASSIATISILGFLMRLSH